MKAGVSSDRDGKQSAQMDSTDKNRFDAFMQLAEFRMDVRKERRQLKGQRAQPVLSRATLMSSADVTPALSLERQKKSPKPKRGQLDGKGEKAEGCRLSRPLFEATRATLRSPERVLCISSRRHARRASGRRRMPAKERLIAARAHQRDLRGRSAATQRQAVAHT